MIDLTLFDALEPSVRDMFVDYPELAEYEEFAELKPRELRFCWLVGNRTSPLISLDKEPRVRAAIKQVYGDVGSQKVRPEVKSMLDGKIPEKILNAINRMASFNPSYRLRAKLLDEYIFEQLNALVVISDKDRERMAVDTDEKKKYSDLVIKVSSEMPNLVKRMEGGYGIRMTKKSNDAKEPKVLVNLKDVKDRIQE